MRSIKTLKRVNFGFCLKIMDNGNKRKSQSEPNETKGRRNKVAKVYLRRLRAQVESQSADDASRDSSVRPAQQAAGREQCRQWAMAAAEATEAGRAAEHSVRGQRRGARSALHQAQQRRWYCALWESR